MCAYMNVQMSLYVCMTIHEYTDMWFSVSKIYCASTKCSVVGAKDK